METNTLGQVGAPGTPMRRQHMSHLAVHMTEEHATKTAGWYETPTSMARNQQHNEQQSRPQTATFAPTHKNCVHPEPHVHTAGIHTPSRGSMHDSEPMDDEYTMRGDATPEHTSDTFAAQSSLGSLTPLRAF